MQPFTRERGELMIADCLAIPEFDEIAAALAAAIGKFHNNSDQYLLEFNLNERTISHRLALHLQRTLPEWDVDCEYNRNEDTIKTLELPKNHIPWNDLEAKTVFPDIIVHKRGPGPNVLVIEMKKVGLSPDFDYQKLRAYKSELGYAYACLIWIRTGRDGCIEQPDWV
jgi:hypothetical protein